MNDQKRGIVFNIDSSGSLKTRRASRMNRMEIQLRNELAEFAARDARHQRWRPAKRIAKSSFDMRFQDRYPSAERPAANPPHRYTVYPIYPISSASLRLCERHDYFSCRPTPVRVGADSGKFLSHPACPPPHQGRWSNPAGLQTPSRAAASPSMLNMLVCRDELEAINVNNRTELVSIGV